MIAIEKIKLKDLCEFACRIRNKPWRGVIPITLSRALAHTKNPYAGAEDIALLLAYSESRCVAYLGIMPGLLRNKDKTSKVYWFSTFFVSGEFRGQGVGLSLVKEALQLDYDFLSTPMAGTRSEQVFRRAGMKDLAVWEYCSLDLRFLNPLTVPLRGLRTLLRAAHIEPQILGLFIRRLDQLLLPLIKLVFYGFQAPKPGERSPGRYRRGELKNAASPVAFYRGPEWISWMLSYKWLKDRREADAQDRNYFFSGLYDKFEFTAHELFLYSTAREGRHVTMKLLDIHSPFIWQQAALQKASCLEFAQHISSEVLTNRLLMLITIKKKRAYLYRPAQDNSPLADAAGRITFDLCDGDNAFF